MGIATIVFYLLAFVLLLAAMNVISARNPVHTVFWLILCFFNAAGLFVLIGAEYLAMSLVVVYVGAVAVLFLFVIMMLDINIAEMQAGFLAYLPGGMLVAAILLLEMFLLFKAALPGVAARPSASETPMPPLDLVTNTEAIGNVLYTQYVYLFQVAGLILLVAMIGAIVLTLRHRPVRRQKIGRQVNRRREDAVTMTNPRSGEGA